MTSLAEYNNNPGNIRPPKGLTYEGQIGVDEKGFAIFKDSNAGRNALLQDIRAKQKQGLNTPNSFIDKYTPAMGENPEDARDNYKIRMAQHLGLKSTTDPFPEGSEQKIADLIASVEGGQPVTQATEEEPKKEPFVPVADTFPPQEETKQQPKPENVVSPTAGAITGALASTVGQVGSKPELKYAEAPPDVSAAEKAAQKAQRQFDIAEQRLNQRVNSAMPIAGGTDLATLEAEYRRSQFMLQLADQELQAATAAQKAKVAPAPPAANSMASATPQIITDPNAPVQTSQERILQGKIDPTTGNTGRQNMVFNEVTSWEANERELQQKALKEAQKAGLIPDTGQQIRSQFGKPSGTASGLLVKPEVGEPLKQQADLEQKMAEEKAAQERLAQQNEMNRLKNERALAAQEHSQAQSAFNKAQSAKTAGVTRAQNTMETAEDRASLLAQEAQEARAAAKNAPNFANRQLQNFGVATAKSGPIVKGGLGALGGYQAAKGINTLANLSLADLQKRYDDGDRSPALMAALGKAAEATAQVGTGVAAAMPAFGPTTAKIKGAGLAGTAALGMYGLMNAAKEKARQRRDNQ